VSRPDTVTIDFETGAIAPRPQYPPKPIGVSVLRPGQPKRYMAWGHPTGNNCTMTEARSVLRCIWRSDCELVFHNAKFDLDVAQTHLALPLPDWRRVHDTMFLLFLHDPHARSLSLKPSAERILGMAPTEQDVVHQWLIDHGVVKKGARDWGAHICKAPGGLVGKYAIGDTDRTYKLFRKLRGNFGDAYDRERELMLVLLANEQHGIRVDRAGLERDAAAYRTALQQADAYIRRALKAPGLNIDSDRELARALQASGAVRQWVELPSGQLSVSKANLPPSAFKNQRIASVLGYRNRLQTCLSTFMEPWLTTAATTGGLIYTDWHQVRQSHGNDVFAGARTGRLSSSPNFQNIPKSFVDKNDGYVHPSFTALPELPLMRSYILPDKGGVICHRDYNQQELRILAHFEDDKLCAEYNANPLMDVHAYVGQQIQAISGLSLERRAVKILNFGMIYGMGLRALARGINSTVDDAKRLRAAQLRALPGLKALGHAIKQRGETGQAITTWGQREYYAEQPKIIDGRTQRYEYKLLNYLIQGSGADCTKQALINYSHVRRHGRFMITVHDESNVSVPKSAVREEMKLLKDAMGAVQFDVPMITDGKTGPRWSLLKPYKD